MIFVQPIRLCTALRRKNKKYPKCLSLPHMSYVNFFEKPHDDGQNDNKNIIFDVNCKTAKIRGYQALFSWYDGGIIIKKHKKHKSISNLLNLPAIIKEFLFISISKL